MARPLRKGPDLQLAPAPKASPLGLVLLTGGESRRFGAPKHLQPHPQGGSWGNHLVRVFGAVHPKGPVRLLGAALPECPELLPLSDPREGPAVALRTWAAAEREAVHRWWVLGCDQIHWTPERLQSWEAKAAAADPMFQAWVMGRVGGRIQFLGGFLPGTLLPKLANSAGRSLWSLQEALPSLSLEAEGAEWDDVDCPADLAQ